MIEKENRDTGFLRRNLLDFLHESEAKNPTETLYLFLLLNCAHAINDIDFLKGVYRSHHNWLWVREAKVFEMLGLSKDPEWDGDFYQKLFTSFSSNFIKEMADFIHSHASTYYTPYQAAEAVRALIDQSPNRFGMSNTPKPIRNLICTLNTAIGGAPKAICDFAVNQAELFDCFDRETLFDPRVKVSLMEEKPLSRHMALMQLALRSLGNRDQDFQNGFIDDFNQLEEQDLIVSCPRQQSKIEDETKFSAYQLFPYSELKQSSDTLWVQLAIAKLKDNGLAMIVVSDSLLHKNGYDALLREYLVERQMLKAVISLPTNIYYGTRLDTSLLIIGKEFNNPFYDTVHFIHARQFNDWGNKESLNKLVNLLKTQTIIENPVVPNATVSTPDLLENDCKIRTTDYIDFQENIDLPNLNQELLKLEEMKKDYDKNYQAWLESMKD